MNILFVVALAASLTLPAMTYAAEIRVLSTQATEEAYRELVPQFEKETGHKVSTTRRGNIMARSSRYPLLCRRHFGQRIS